MMKISIGISVLKGNSIVGAHFNECFTGIRSLNNNNYTFDGNTFSYNRPANFTGPSSTKMIGIDMEGGTTAFFVKGNHFENPDGDTDPVFIGTKALSVTKDNRSIFGNTYFIMHEGNIANQQNGMTIGELMFSGLMYECNTFEENLNHDIWVQSGIVRKEQGPRGSISQGSPRISSGNTYPGVFDQQFTNSGTLDIDYHHRENTDEELLDGHYSVGSVNKFESGINNNCSGSLGCPNPPCSEEHVGQMKTQFFLKKQQWNSKVNAFPSIVSPVTQASEAIAINGLRYELDTTGNIILLHFALDTTDVKTDSILAWMSHLQTYNSDLQLAKHHFFKGNFALADTLFQNIPSNYQLETNALAEFNDIQAMLTAIKPYIQALALLNALPITIIDSLENYWGTACNDAGALARDILYQNGRLLGPECSPTEERPTTDIQIPVDLSTTHRVKIFPNPANNFLIIERLDELDNIQIRLTDLSLGRTYLERTLFPGKKTIPLDVSMLNPGVYFLSYIGKTAPGKLKFIISH